MHLYLLLDILAPPNFMVVKLNSFLDWRIMCTISSLISIGVKWHDSSVTRKLNLQEKPRKRPKQDDMAMVPLHQFNLIRLGINGGTI
jgi:hypothetical protein